jgi:L-arabinokinase
MVQRDSLRMDLEATLQAVEALKHRRQDLVEEEKRFFQRAEITAVVADIPFLPFLAASRHGIPSVGLGNFTWDWVYEYYAANDGRWREPVDWIREAYRHCELFLQLPMNGDCSACPRVLPVPLVARHARRSRREVRTILGIGEERRAFLISFTDLDLSVSAQRRLEGISDTLFLYKQPLRFQFTNAYCVDQAKVSYAELVAAVDGVITKPGYGIIADCVAQGTPVIYTDRGDFPEYEILVTEMSRWLPAVYMPSEDLYEGGWEWALKQLPIREARMSVVATNGSQVCARTILQHIGWRP